MRRWTQRRHSGINYGMPKVLLFASSKNPLKMNQTQNHEHEKQRWTTATGTMERTKNTISIMNVNFVAKNSLNKIIIASRKQCPCEFQFLRRHCTTPCPKYHLSLGVHCIQVVDFNLCRHQRNCLHTEAHGRRSKWRQGGVAGRW